MGMANMRDQYNFLKAIDTSSSSPELKEPQRPRRQQATKLRLLAPDAASSSASSNSNKFQPKPDNGRGRAGLLRGTLQSLVRPRRLQLSSSGESKSSCSRRADGGHFARQEDGDVRLDDSDEEPIELARDDSLGHSHQRRLFALTGGSRTTRPALEDESDRVGRQKRAEQVPVNCQTRKRPLGRRAQLAAGRTMSPPNETELRAPNSNKSTTETSATVAQQQPAAHYPTSETNSAQLRGRLQELTQCYDEIDQIYDYIRGLAPLPANLRKIKAIDFEQIERERQRIKASGQRQVAAAAPPTEAGRSQQAHHQHRQRFVRSIESQNSNRTSSVDAANEKLKKSSKVRQRVAAELIEERPIESAPQPPAQRQPSKLRETLQLLVPRPIRVTARTSESQRPSIKRVESLNLGPANLESAERQRLEAKLSRQDGRKSNSSRSPSYHLLKAGANGRGEQMFRLPRAHSASTLSKPVNALPAESHQRPTGKFATVQAKESKLEAHHEEAARERSPPLARLKGISFDQRNGSLNRNAADKRPSFESELVESYVDDDDDDNDDEHEARKEIRPPVGRTPSSSTSLKSPVLESASGSWGRETNCLDADESRLSSPASERWSYADSKRDQRQADKSHSDYDNDSASETSETSAATSSEPSNSNSSSNSASTSASSSSSTSGRNKNEVTDEIRRTLGQGAASRRPPSSKRSHQLRPTTSSSPSSGRPASPVDMTNESDEMEVVSMASQQASSFAGKTAATAHRQQSASEQRELEQEHIYEQIPPHRERSARTSAAEPTGRVQQRPREAARGSKAFASLSTNLLLAAAPPKRVGSGGASHGRHLQPVTMNHPVAYAANVAANRRYQQQVAALFTLQQQRNRHQQLAAPNQPASRQKTAPLASLPHQPSHQRRASASNTQILAPRAAIPTGPMSLNVGSLKWKHHQASRELAAMPHRQRSSMSNIHLLSGAIPLASLCSAWPKQPLRSSEQRFGSKMSSKLLRTTERERNHNASLLDDPEAASTGTTNSTSSYEAAIKNSEPDPLGIDLISPPSDEEQSRPASSKRSGGSASGSRSLTTQNQQVLQQSTSSNTQQTTMLMKVPKLSKQSHLLKRPLPKPPSTNRSCGSSSGGVGSSRQLQKSSGISKATATTGTQSTAVDVFS